MPVTMRHVQAEGHPVKVNFPTGFAVAQGDFIYNDAAVGAKPAGAASDAGTPAANQEYLHDNFLGVAVTTRSATDPAGTGLVTSEGVYAYPCAALGSQLEIGALFGVAENAGGTALENQKVIPVATENLAVGRLVERALAGATSVKLRIYATRTTGGPQAMA